MTEHAAGKKPEAKPKVQIELEILGTSDWKSCTVNSVVGYPKRPARLELELLERKSGSSIGTTIPSGKLTLLYEDGVAATEGLDLSSCEKTSQLEIRIGHDGLFTSKLANVSVGSAKAGLTVKQSAKSRFKLGVDGETLKAPMYSAVIPMETFDETFNPQSSKVEVTVMGGRGVKFTNASDNHVLATDARYCTFVTVADGSYRLAVEFKGQFEITLELKANGVKKSLKLVYKPW